MNIWTLCGIVALVIIYLDDFKLDKIYNFNILIINNEFDNSVRYSNSPISKGNKDTSEIANSTLYFYLS